MGNIFTDLVAKLTRRQKKNKPVPVPYKEPIRRQPEPSDNPLVAVTYNRVDGVVSGGTLNRGTVRINESRPPLQQKPKGAYWDDEAKIYKGTNYVTQVQEAERAKRRRRQEDDDDFLLFATATTFDDSFYYQNQPENVCDGSESASGYDYPRETFSPVYEAPSPSYEAPASTTTYDSGSSWSSSGTSDSSSSSYGGSSSYSSDSGSSYSSSDSGGGSYGGE